MIDMKQEIIAKVAASVEPQVLEEETIFKVYNTLLRTMSQSTSDMSYMRESFWRRIKFAFTTRA